MNVVSPSKSQENTTPKGVKYFKQFPRNLLVPYGSSLDPNDQQKLLKYLQPSNCELLLRPSVFFSEFCLSVSQCLQEVQEVLNVDGLEHGLQNMRSFVTYMEHLKQLFLPLSRGAGEPPSKPQVISVLHSLVSNDHVAEEMINCAFTLGNALLSMACHCVASRVLLHNPTALSLRVSSLSGADLEFKGNPSVRTMSEFIVNEYLKTAISSLIDRTEITNQFSDLLQEGVKFPQLLREHLQAHRRHVVGHHRTVPKKLAHVKACLVPARKHLMTMTPMTLMSRHLRVNFIFTKERNGKTAPRIGLDLLRRLVKIFSVSKSSLQMLNLLFPCHLLEEASRTTAAQLNFRDRRRT